MLNNKQKTLLISGASGGLGFEVAQYFLQKSWRVIILTRSKNNITLKHHNLIIIESEHSVTGIKNSYKPLQHALNDSGLDLLINNAGFALVGALEYLSEDDINNQMQVNFLSHVYLTKLCLPYLRKNSGKIMNISSLFGGMGCPFHSLYCASKYAIEGFSEALHYELKPQKIACSIIVPGRHHTKFGANMQVVQPKDKQDKLKNIYGEQYQGFYKLKQKLTDKKANNPQRFAQKIYQLSKRSHLPVKIAVNLDSHIPQAIRKYTPSWLYAWLQNKMFSKYFYPKASS